MPTRSEPLTVGPYRLLTLIGAGGMGEVFLAERVGPQGFVRRVVVKRLLPHKELDAEARAAFFDEAKLTAQLNHPNVVQVIELGEHDGRYFIAMEYLAGASVRGLVDALAAEHTPLPPELAGHLCAQALRGLHHAHELEGPDGAPLGLVHRDVSPENLLVGFAGEVKVVDFGLAKAFLAPSQRQSGVVRGKAAYMSPEQLLGRPLDRRSDVFAMGAVLYELLVGSPAVAAHTVGPLAPAAHGLLEVARRAMKKDPAERFASAAELADALEAALAAAGTPASGPALGALLARLEASGRLAATRPALDAPGPTGTLDIAAPQSPQRSRTRRWPLAAAGLATAAIGAAFFFSTPRQAPSPPVAEAPPVVEAPAAPEPVAAPSPPEPPAPSPPPHRKRAATTHAAAAPRPEPRPGTGEVVLRANPWAEVFLEGKSLGTTPMAPLELPARHYDFIFKNSELGTERRVSGDLKAGERLVLKANLQP
ncbi:MAG: serine/threonine protein kinase [Archangiaceae bacterium]|nr:serine/threonine protein kinase [Archangiaceae bacterium]